MEGERREFKSKDLGLSSCNSGSQFTQPYGQETLSYSREAGFELQHSSAAYSSHVERTLFSVQSRRLDEMNVFHTREEIVCDFVQLD